MSSDPYVSANQPRSGPASAAPVEPPPSAGSPAPAMSPQHIPAAGPPEAAMTRPSAPAESAVKFTRAAALWLALIVGFIILTVLLVFMAQNTESASFAFLGWHWGLPLGVAILLAAVCGGLITVLAGTVRIYQLRRAAKKNLEMTP